MSFLALNRFSRSNPMIRSEFVGFIPAKERRTVRFDRKVILDYFSGPCLRAWLLTPDTTTQLFDRRIKISHEDPDTWYRITQNFDTWFDNLPTCRIVVEMNHPVTVVFDVLHTLHTLDTLGKTVRPQWYGVPAFIREDSLMTKECPVMPHAKRARL